MPDLTGQTIGRYRILEKLGEGGMALVYKAHDTRLERQVAIKIIRREVFSPLVLERVLKRFEREAKALARLSHPNIVHVHDYGKYRGAPYLVMEYLPGGVLKTLSGASDRLSWQEAARLLLPIAEALDYAHSQNVIHRDVKPSNILLTGRGQPMLSDFGIARILEDEQTQGLTASGTGVGTPEYMAPEQWTGKACPQSDLYSLGVVFYELVTGRKPYTADTPAALMLKQINDPLPPPRQFAPDLPEGVEQVILKALAKKPDERYPSMQEFASALEAQLSASAGEKPTPPAWWKRKQPKISPPKETPASPLEPLENQQKPAARPPALEVPAEPVVPAAAGLQIRPAAPERPLGMPAVPVSPAPQKARPLTDTRMGKKSAGDFQETTHDGIPPNPPGRKQANLSWWQRWGAWLGVAGAVLALLVLVTLFGLWTRGYIGPRPFVSPVPTRAPMPTETHVPTLTPVPTQAPRPTDTIIPTPTLGIGSTWTRPADGMVMVYVPAGDFIIGSPEGIGESDEHPQHTVYLDAYWIDQTEVTNLMYEKCVIAGGCQVPSSSGSTTRSSYYGNSQYADYPVIYADWNKAQSYCKWAGARLPTEAEWEKAARGTDGRTYPWGNDAPTCSLANFGACIGDTDKVGSHPSGASTYSVLDMAGGVWEWVNDWYGETYYRDSPQSNPQGPSSGTYRLLRGGALSGDVSGVRSALRSVNLPTVAGSGVGFRCSRGIFPTEEQAPMTSFTPTQEFTISPTIVSTPITYLPPPSNLAVLLTLGKMYGKDLCKIDITWDYSQIENIKFSLEIGRGSSVGVLQEVDTKLNGHYYVNATTVGKGQNVYVTVTAYLIISGDRIYSEPIKSGNITCQ
jgi:eukaryotic-like serine/threonine-protein kinase